MDNTQSYNDKLTTSAKEAVNDTILEFQERLLEKANQIAQKGQTANKEISLRDIIEAKEAIFNIRIEKQRSEYKRKRLVTYITLIGALYSVVGIFIYIFQNKAISFEKDLGLLVVITGIVTALVGFAYAQLQSKRIAEKNIRDIDIIEETDFELIRRWQIIEKMGSDLMIRNGVSLNKSKSVNDILNYLSFQLDDKQMSTDLRDLLSFRNKILHEQYQLSKHEKQIYLDKADKIIDRLERLNN